MFIVQINVTLNVTLGYLASITNVTLGLQRSDGNVTLPGQSPVGVTEEAATGHMTVFRAHISTPAAIEPGECCTRPVRRGTVWGRTSSSAATHDGSTEPRCSGIDRGAQADIEPATGARVTQHIGSAKAVRNRSTPVHSSAGTSP